MFRLRYPIITLLNKSVHGFEFKQKVAACVNFSFSGQSVPLDTTTAGGSAGVQKTDRSGKQPAREPLVKNFFVGVADRELLAYPEAITREDLNQLRDALLPVHNYFADEVDLQAIDATRTIPPEVIENVRELGLYGTNASQDFGGRGWQLSGTLMAAEEEAQCPDLALTLLSHRVVIDALDTLGTDYQKQRFLPKLASGSMLASEAIYEYSVPEFDFFNTIAEYNTDNQSWMINGAKSFVVTGPKPAGSTQLFLVITQTKRDNIEGDAGRGTTMFLVESDCEGVEVGEQHLSFGCRGVQSSTVHFKNVIVPDSCVLGEKHEANSLAEKLLTSSRLRQSLIGMVMAKNVVSDMTHHLVHTKQCGASLSDMNINQTHLSEAMCSTYAAESIIYMTAGLLDSYEAQDVALEAAVTKYFTLRELHKISNKYMDLLGPKCLLAGERTELLIRNAAHLYTLGETMDMLRLYIATSGLQHAGTFFKDSVKKARNPLFHPMHLVSNLFQASSINNPKINKNMRLRDNVHPSFETAAQWIEKSVARLELAVHTLFNRYGADIVEQHNELQRLTEMATNIYVMYACVARASRSYCIGLYLADHEMLLASTISYHCSEVVKRLCQEVHFGKFLNNDYNFHRLGKQVANQKGYFAVHPCTYNF